MVAVLTLATPVARGEDRVTVRGAYYREQSTRVIQPMAEVSKDLPGDVDVSAHYLLDAITSASIAAGAASDNIFTELRNEVGIAVGKTWNHTRIGFNYKYSHESDYFSHTGGVSFSQGLWDNTGTLTVNTAYSNNAFGAIPMFTKHLNVYFLSGGYTQALSPTTIAQVVYDAAYYDGNEENPYLSSPSNGHETPPLRRLRHAFAARVARFFPSAGLTAHLYYRFYFDQFPGANATLPGQGSGTADPWHMTAHTIEGRLWKQLGRDVEARLSYRVHRQSGANFWCNEDPAGGGTSGCYGPTAEYHSIDPKFGQLATQLAEIKILWDARVLADVPFFEFFAPGTFELSYGYYFQSSRYGGVGRDQTGYASFLWPHDSGGAHLLQAGYSLPF